MEGGDGESRLTDWLDRETIVSDPSRGSPQWQYRRSANQLFTPGPLCFGCEPVWPSGKALGW